MQDRYGISILMKLSVDFSDLRPHRFKHKFNCISPMCKCQLEEETTEHYLAGCTIFQFHRSNLHNSISMIINSDATSFSDSHLNSVLLYGGTAYNMITNKLILKASIKFIKVSKRFKVLEAFSDTMVP